MALSSQEKNRQNAILLRFLTVDNSNLTKKKFENSSVIKVRKIATVLRYSYLTVDNFKLTKKKS